MLFFRIFRVFRGKKRGIPRTLKAIWYKVISGKEYTGKVSKASGFCPVSFDNFPKVVKSCIAFLSELWDKLFCKD